MALNLNKSDQQVSKFNLSKNDETVSGGEKKNKSVGIVWVIIALLMIGGIAWYVLSDKKTATDPVVAGKDSPMKSSLAKDTIAETKKSPDNSSIVAAQASGASTATVATRSTEALQNAIACNFNAGSAALQPDMNMVKELIALLSKNPGQKLIVKGYASSEGNLVTNQQLSEERARAFRDFLVQKGIPSTNITTEAKGIDDPVVTNDTEDGRRKNRRVQVTIAD